MSISIYAILCLLIPVHVLGFGLGSIFSQNPCDIPYLRDITPQCVSKDPCEMSVLNSLTLKCWRSCPERDRWESALEKELKQIVGQPHSMNILHQALNSRSVKANRPLIFHFSGPNGCGKTLTALAIGKALFSQLNEVSSLPNGVLFLKGSSYIIDSKLQKEDPATFLNLAQKHKDTIRNVIAEQLSKCSKSLIIFDESIIPNKRIMQVFEEFFDGVPILHNGKQIRTDQAIFILISDFGSEQFSPHLSHKELEEQVYKETRDAWGYTLDKTTHLIRYIIPFFPLELPTSFESLSIYSSPPSTANEFIKIEFERFEDELTRTYPTATIKIVCDDFCKDKVTKALYYFQMQSDVYRYRNYRGLNQLFDSHISDSIGSQLKKRKSTATAKQIIVKISVDLDNTVSPINVTVRDTQSANEL